MSGTYVVHIKHHHGWVTKEAEGADFAEAAITATVESHKEGNLDLDSIPHRVEFTVHHMSDGDYPHVVFYETEARKVYPSWVNPSGYTTPGELWFSVRVREGQPDDCPKCGGTGRNHYNPFRQCWACGDPEQEAPSSGKAAAT